MLGSLRKRTPGTPLSPEERQQRIDAARASAAKRRRNLGDYEREVRAIPMLEAGEERSLIARWKDKGEAGARDRVVNAHLRLAVSGARKLSGYGLPTDDLVAAGNVGLLQAAERYDPSKGARFSTFALPYIRAAQLRHVLDNWSIVRLGTDRDQKRLFFSLRGDLRTIAEGQASTEQVQDIARRRGVKAASVQSMAARLSGRDASLNVRAGEDDEGDEWIDRLTGGDHAEDRLVAQETRRLQRAAAARAVASLNERERRVLAARWIRQPPATLHEVGRGLGISAERVRQIENQAMRRVQAMVAKDPRLAKRTPGAPLSDAELRQRREAARSRWATGGGALAGSLAAASSLRALSGALARRRLEADETTGERAFRLAERRRDRRNERIVATRDARKRDASRPFTTAVDADEARFGPGARQSRKPGVLARRVRDLRAEIAAGERQVGRLTTRLAQIEDAFAAGRSPGPGLTEREADRQIADLGTRARDAQVEIEELRAAQPKRRTWRDEHNYARAQTGRRRAHKATVPATIDAEQLRQARGAVRNRAEQQAEQAFARVAQRWHRAAPGLREAFKRRAAGLIGRRIRGKWMLPAVAAGAVAGAAVGWGASLRKGAWLDAAARRAEALSKVAPPDDAPFPPEREPQAVTPSSARDEAALADRLAVLFRSWLENPGRVGNREDIARALDPLYGILRSSADTLQPPPPAEASLYGSPDERTIAFSFDARSPEVERRLREYALDRIRAITEESRETIRRVLIEAAQQGLPVDEQARRIREAIGLSPGQQGWVTSYRRQLEVLDPRVLNRALRDRRHDSPIRRAIETNTPLAREDVERYVASYHRRALAYRAISIARTEALRGANTGMVETARMLLQEHPGVTVEKTWIATGDERTRDAHRALDGKVVTGLDTPFEIDGQQIRWPHDDQASPEMTVNCLLPGTRVYAPGLLAATVRKFDGDVIRVRTAKGADMTCTINHPILTSRGWVAAQFLKEGDRVVRASPFDWGELVGDDQHAPPRVEELHDALHRAGLARLQVAGGVQFHHERVDGEVGVVFAEWKLLGDQHAALPEPIREPVLLGRGLMEQASASIRLALQPLEALLHASNGSVGGAHLRLARALVHLAPFEPLGLTSCAQSAAVFSQDAPDDVARHPMLIREALDRLAAVVCGEERLEIDGAPHAPGLPIRPDEPRLVKDAAHSIGGGVGLLGDLPQSEAAPIELDDVVLVTRFPWRGQVYNLETEGRTYIADGLINHNCRCTLGLRLVPKPGYGRFVAEAA